MAADGSRDPTLSGLMFRSLRSAGMQCVLGCSAGRS